VGANSLSARGARRLGPRLVARARLYARARRPAFVCYLQARWSRALIPPAAEVVSAVVVSAALGAVTAFLVAGPGLPEGVASVGPRVSVQSSSAGFPIAQRAGPGRPSAGGSGPASTTSSHARSSGADDGGSATGPGFALELATQGEPSHSEQGGTSGPPAGSSPGAPPDDEEPSEEVPGEEEEEEEAAPPEEPPGDEEKVTICHKAGATSAKTLAVGASAVEEHLAHGDTLGACP
jgi:hypothetical protein